MPRYLSPDRRAAGLGSKESIPASAFEQETLKAGVEVEVWSKKVNDDQTLYHGYGVENRDYASAFVGLDLVASGNGSGTAGDDIEGDLVLGVTNSEGDRILASTTYDNLGELRDSLTESRSDRLIEPAHTANGDLAGPGRRLVLLVNADSGSDGVEIDPSASSGKMYYGKVQR